MISYSKPSVSLKDSDYEVIKDILNSGKVSIGEWTKTLENIITERFNVRYAIATNNATNALIISVKAVGMENKVVAVPAFTWPSTVYALECNNNKLIFSDVDSKDWLIDAPPADYVMPVDTFGNQAKSMSKALVYDAAHGFDCPLLGHRGKAEVISFSFTKVVTATEGGMILTNDEEVANTCRELRRLSCRMPEVNAYIATRSIDFWDTYAKEKRIQIVDKYKSLMKFDYQIQKHNYNNSVFTILLPSQSMRNKILRELSLKDIETKVYYEPVVEGLETTDDIYSRAISLPLHPFLKDTDIECIAEISNKAVKGCPGIDYLNRYFRKKI